METAFTVLGRPLGKILEAHAQWAEGESSGKRCVFQNETLNEAQLREVNLQRAILRGTTLLDADLSGAKLVDADLNRIDAKWADFRGADMTGAL